MPQTNIPPPDHQGIIAHAKAWMAGALRYLKSRLSLAGIEAGEAAGKYGIAAALAVGGLVLVLLGYIFLIITAVFGIAAAFDNEHAWILILGIATLLHIAGGAGLVLLAWKRAKGGVFPVTIEELKKDRIWLTNPEK